MRAIWLMSLMLSSHLHCLAQTEVGGHLRLQWIRPEISATGPLTQANDLRPGFAPLPTSNTAIDSELRVKSHGLTGVVTLQQAFASGRTGESRAWVNELYASHDGSAWQFNAGKKIVSWDVGHGFRPNDLVQQEERRALINRTLEGRPLLMAEHFSTDAAWSLVWVNPTAAAHQVGPQEPALAGRVYQQVGAADWYGFTRLGAHTGNSVGGALAWVTSDALELHGSIRISERIDSQVMNPGVTGLVSVSPWQEQPQQHVKQFLLGGTWTHANRLSLLMETWWDGAAFSDEQWDAFARRNSQLATLASMGSPPAAVASNLGWQAQAFNASSHLRRGNVFMRLSWQHENWHPSMEVLYMPTDQGRVVTTSLIWQGNRVHVQGGLRVNAGPTQSVVMQLPARSTVYLASTWTF